MKNLYKLFVLIVLPLLSVSCIVDDEIETGLNTSPYTVGFERSSTLESYFEDVGPVNADVTVNVLGGNSGIKLESDTTINYVIDPSSTAVAGNEYTLSGSSFVIKAGKTFGILPLIVNSGGLNPAAPTELVIRLTNSTDSNTLVSQINDTYTITFVGCQADHAGMYSNPDITASTANQQATITQTAPNTFTVSAIPYLSTGGGTNPVEFSFTNVCGDINITGWPFSGSNFIVGTGTFDETTGALTFNYVAHDGASASDPILFDFSSPDDASTYTPL